MRRAVVCHHLSPSVLSLCQFVCQFVYQLVFGCIPIVFFITYKCKTFVAFTHITFTHTHVCTHICIGRTVNRRDADLHTSSLCPPTDQYGWRLRPSLAASRAVRGRALTKRVRCMCVLAACAIQLSNTLRRTSCADEPTVSFTPHLSLNFTGKLHVQFAQVATMASAWLPAFIHSRMQLPSVRDRCICDTWRAPSRAVTLTTSRPSPP